MWAPSPRTWRPSGRCSTAGSTRRSAGSRWSRASGLGRTPSSTSLRGCVVAKNVDVKFGAKLEEGVVVADECRIGEGAVLNPHVKVYPFKTVDPGAIVSESIIWQSGGARGLFGERGVTGLIGVDITPEMAVRVAMAYASVLPKGSAVVTCRDITRSARMVKRA